MEYRDQHGTRQRLEASAVILATGGFGASTHLLRQHAPHVRGRVAGQGCCVGWEAGGRSAGLETRRCVLCDMMSLLLLLRPRHSAYVPNPSPTQTAELPTTNGPWAQGEGLTLARSAGASLLHLDQVQARPCCCCLGALMTWCTCNVETLPPNC